MQTQSRDEIVRRIDVARREEGNGVLAFDGDGTLWSGDVGEDFFHAMVARDRFEPSATLELKRIAAEHRLDTAGDGAALARRLYEEYLEQRFPEIGICELMAWGCAGWGLSELGAFAVEVANKSALPARFHTEAVSVLAWAQKAGIEVFLVSASPRAIVLEAAKAVGVDAAHVVAATPLLDGTTLLPTVDRPIPYGPGKVTRLRERIGDRPLYAAFGDNVFDLPMLNEAKVGVAVRPKPRLLERAHEAPGIVEILRLP